MVTLPLERFPPLTSPALGAPPWDPLQPPGFTNPPSSCDIVIVGAGITGLSAAAACATAGRQVVVLERALGTGATARSGGVVLGDTVEGPHPDFEGCEELLRQWILRSGADCDLRWRGCLELARNRDLSPAPVDWRDQGTVRLVGRVPGGVLNPVKLQAALLAAARDAGAAIVDAATVCHITPSGSGLQVSMEHSAMAAAAGLMAVDAMSWRHGFVPWPERVMTVSLQTAPISDADLATLGLKADEAFYTVDTPLLWGRVMPDRSLLVGRETRPFPAQPVLRELHDGLTEASARLTNRVRGLHPVLSHVAIQTSWTGPLARTEAGHPTIESDPIVPTLLWAGGYGGQGIAQGFALGRKAANRILHGKFATQ
jgi:glycine/D-amino acid oxidase-like deaminating enzyme